jgi:hypothetical protein
VSTLGYRNGKSQLFIYQIITLSVFRTSQKIYVVSDGFPQCASAVWFAVTHHGPKHHTIWEIYAFAGIVNLTFTKKKTPLLLQIFRSTHRSSRCDSETGANPMELGRSERRRLRMASSPADTPKSRIGRAHTLQTSDRSSDSHHCFKVCVAIAFC